MSHRRQIRGRVMGQQGFTLVEQIVTIAIMSMVLVAGVAALSTGALGLTVTVSRNQAMNLAQEPLECIKGADFQVSDDYNAAGCPDGPDGSGYVTTTIVQGVEPNTTEADPSLWPTCTTCKAQLITVSVSRGTNIIMEIEDLKVNRP